jgi:hypothetical protein
VHRSPEKRAQRTLSSRETISGKKAAILVTHPPRRSATLRRECFASAISSMILVENASKSLGCPEVITPSSTTISASCHLATVLVTSVLIVR